MRLSDLVIPTKEIKLGEQAVAFRGLSFHDLETLFASGLDDDIDSLVAMFQTGTDADGQPVSEDDLFNIVISKFPRLVTSVLILAADDGGDDEDEIAPADVKRLPLGFQIEAIEAVFVLTTEAAGGAKKLLDKVKDLMGGLGQARNT
tara:strand:+ start:2656 stop:3096 length:441 start_codon:yes stop_codon:yes gene_type:complete